MTCAVRSSWVSTAKSSGSTCSTLLIFRVSFSTSTGYDTFFDTPSNIVRAKLSVLTRHQRAETDGKLKLMTASGLPTRYLV